MNIKSIANALSHSTRAVATIIVAMAVAGASQAAPTRHGSAPDIGPIGFRCDGDPPLGFIITFYNTKPGSLAAERHGERIVMTQQTTASGIRYLGANAEYSEHQGVAQIIWPGQPKPLRCTSH